MTTKIEWVKNPDGSKGETWNPLAGCTKVSSGCTRCYAERMAVRQIGMGNKNYAGTIKDGRWSGQVNLIPDALDKPLHWRKPRTVFVNSMSDLFHKDVPFEFIDKVMGVMRSEKCTQHTFMILTKRPERMERYWRSRRWVTTRSNVHLYTSIEDQATADERIPWLLKTPAAVRGVSLEPMLGPVDLDGYLPGEYSCECGYTGSRCGDYEQCDSCGEEFPPPDNGETIPCSCGSTDYRNSCPRSDSVVAFGFSQSESTFNHVT